MMPSGLLTFREATIADTPNILPLVRSAYRGDSSRKGWTTEADLVADERIDENGIAEKISGSDSVILLAHDDQGVLAGCCEIAKKDTLHAYFGLFAVDPKRQTGGFGKLILSQAEEYAKKVWGVEKLEMCVIWTRDELISWYIRRGYVRTDRTMPFPYADLVNGRALRDDLYFSVLEKSL